MTGRTVCRLHGGRSRAGIASATFKHGKDSKYLKHLPASLAPHFHPDDPKLLELTNEIALIEAGIAELLVQQQGQTRASHQARERMWDLVERKARLAAIDSRRRKDEHEMVARVDFARLAKALLMAIGAYIEDRAMRQKIQDDIFRILELSQVPFLPATAGE